MLKSAYGVKIGADAAKTTYTKSNLRLGREMHQAYKVEFHGLTGKKKYKLPNKKRIDFLDINNKIIYELKPHNPRSIKQGLRQLDTYKQALQTMEKFKAYNWETVLETY